MIFSSKEITVYFCISIASNNIYLFPTRVNKPPTTINMIGEKDDAGPINPVRFTFPKFPNKKSITPSAINMYPIICINVFYFVTSVPSR